MPCPCQLCPSPEATVHMTEIAPDGTRQELHLCRACVQRLQLHPEREAPDLAQLRAQPLHAPESPAATGPVCEACGLEWSAYAETNLFGCPSCLEAFDQPLTGILERYQGSTRHQGRLPLGAPVDEPAPPRPRKPRAPSKAARRAALQARLRAAVAEERFEDAARLRDDLKALEDPA